MTVFGHCEHSLAETWTVLTANAVVTGDSLSLDPDSTLLSVGGGEATQIGLGECVAVMRRTPREHREFRDASSRTYVETLSGEIILAESVSFHDDAVRVEHRRWGRLSLQSEVLRRIHFGASPFAAAFASDFSGIRFGNGDALAGKILSVSGQTLLIESPDLGKIPVDGLDALSDIVFQPKRAAPADSASDPGPRSVKVWLRTDEILTGELVAASHNVWTVRTAHSDTPETVGAFLIKAVCFTDNVLFVSSRTPARVEATPFFDRIHPWQADLSLDGGTMSSDGITAFRGISMHSRTAWTLDLTELPLVPGARFCALAGIDDTAWRGTGDAELTVTVDGHTQARQRLSPGQRPHGVFADLSAGGKEFALCADFGSGGSSGDFVDVLWGAIWLPRPRGGGTP